MVVGVCCTLHNNLTYQLTYHINIISDYTVMSLYRFEYHWADGTNVKKPIKCSAPKYIDYLMTWVQEQLDDENIFPSKIGEFVFRNVVDILISLSLSLSLCRCFFSS